MDLHIHIGTNLEYFELLNKGKLLSQGKKDRDLASFFMQNFPGELADTISPQYEINFMGIREIKKRFGPEAFNKISGIYYGSDNCEYLVPYKAEIEKAIEKFGEFNKNFPPHKVRTFTLVTPYVGDKMLEKLEETLDFLNNLKTKYTIEVVVNDFGVLRLLNKKYTNLIPIFGRLIHKVLKTPLIDTFGYEAHPAGELIKNKSEQEKLKLRDEIVKWQMKFYSSSEVNLDIYINFLKKYNINRVALDYMEKREELFSNKENVDIDLYYPWAIIFTGRLCDTSAIENPSRGFYATDDICPRTCNRYDVFYKVKTNGYKMVQRGNAGYRSELNLDFLKQEFIENKNNRLIFSPFITV
ncbi:MAG: hypothetical protein Q9M94_07105 [Candidatus Gracilibacteria bacterium]|nr:hypothetical protein [Candidatus Gracilibacteria bacterium]MDQ7022476.1 hypothetical protein [Candidatus Gracilibacteria bacterium]